MKKNFFSTILIFYGLLAFLLGAILWWNSQLSAVDQENKQNVSFVIDKGEGVSEITSQLKGQSLIKNELAFKIWLVVSGIAKKIRAGSYYLAPSMTTKEIAENLTKGSNDRWVTIVEGLRSEQIGEVLIKEGFAIDPMIWEKETKSLEGQLFPDSYLIPKTADQVKILAIINKNFQKKVVDGLKANFYKSKLSMSQVLILASIVEREAKKDTDRAIVAGILLKRLNNNWPLQVDASIQYAVASKNCSILKSPCDWWPDRLTSLNLEINSPYNTYHNPDLPPGPICNPGLSAIKAVLEPSESPNWYYISGSDGLMHYAKTAEEHAINIQKYLK